MARASGSYPEGRWFDSTRRYHFYKNCLWTFSSAGRASALQAEGHRFEPYNVHHGPVVQLVRMPACHAGGRRFEPVPDRQFLFRGASSLRRHSQVVRQRSAKPLFPGSNPGVGVYKRQAKVEFRCEDGDTVSKGQLLAVVSGNAHAVSYTHLDVYKRQQV